MNPKLRTLTIGNTTYILVDSEAQEKIGDLAQLQTADKETLVGAINEALLNGGSVDSVNGQTGVVVLTASDVGAATAAGLSQEVSDRTAADAQMQTQINALGNGSPIPVETIAEMTDPTKAYLYTGSETGESTGYWYTYNTTLQRFVPRGEYGAGVTIDNTLTVAGAAADAKATGDAFANVNGRLDGLSNLDESAVKPTFEQGYRHLQTGGTLKTSSAWCTSVEPVSISKGATITVAEYYKFQLIDPVAENNGAVLVSATSDAYTAANDISAYIEIRNNDGTNVTPSQAQDVISIVSTPLIVTKIKDVESRVDDVTVVSKNLFNKDDVVTGQYVNYNNGAFVSNGDFWRSKFIPITGGETYTLRYINQMAFYSGEDVRTFISGVSGYSANTGAVSSTATAPANAKYVVICGHNSQLDSEQFERGDHYTGYADYGYVINEEKLPSSLMYTRISDIISRIIFSSNAVHIKLLGDSVTAGQGGTGYTNDAQHGELILTDSGYGTYYTNPNGYCWANLLKAYFEEHFNCTVTNYGCSGMRVYRMKEYLSTLISDDDDIVIFMGGLNDRNDNSAHTTLEILESNIQSIIDYCHANDKEIIIMSPIPTLDNETGTKNFKTDDIDHAYMKVSSKNRMEYISVFKRMNDYCLASNTALSSLLNSDGLHPNDNGYSIMYYIICTGLGIGVYPVAPN